jgi:DMSO/TMAO reductase YedYZ molybdopterin-dependent catalytic subunit
MASTRSLSQTSPPAPPAREPLPPGQVWGKKFVIYAAMGVQHVDPAKWRLEVTGLVKTPLIFGYDEFMSLPMRSYSKTFSCVTSWSIERPLWEGVPIKYLADAAQVKPEAKWVMFHCYDGYTAPIPVEDALHEDSIVALKMNGRPLSAEQGFPARPFMPHLYGWKSAKWLGKIEFIAEYADGYWEAYGYHERGDIYEEERFKGSGGGKHYARRAFGTA